MDKKQLKALKASIKKYKKAVSDLQKTKEVIRYSPPYNEDAVRIKFKNGKTRHVYFDNIHCPLCIVNRNTCYSCIIYNHTGKRSCHGTPFYRIWGAIRAEYFRGLVTAADAELRFLQSLLPTKKKG
jgi:hypothetical protein